MKTTDFGFPSIVAFDDEIKNTPKYSDYSNVVDLVMDNVETNGMSEEEIERLRSEVEDMVEARANELKENAQWERADVVGEDDNSLGVIDPNDKDVENFDENFERVTKDVDKTGMSNEELGKLYEEKKIADEMADFQKSLDDYASKNKKGRDDIPVTTRR